MAEENGKLNETERDVTDKVAFLNNDDELLPIIKCVCGQKFEPWTFIISIYKDDPTECQSCGRKLFFRNMIRVFEKV
jgi:DNA-directed RNA polymerase subunit RPC12/RpoP